ncbi:MAG: hypothetical protein JEZ03_06545 [Bacteroidales bacterium]|nr:hypothetical protein [Bacteroidales bacterium]
MTLKIKTYDHMKNILFILICLFTSCVPCTKRLTKGYYESHFEDIENKLMFHDDSTFVYETNNYNLYPKVVKGKWDISKDTLILNSYINKDTPKIDCSKTNYPELGDTIHLNMFYVDSTRFEGDLLLWDKDNVFDLVFFSENIKFIRPDSVINKITVLSDWIPYVNQSINFEKYNYYECYIKSDSYRYFINSKYLIRNNALINLEYKEKYSHVK